MTGAKLTVTSRKISTKSTRRRGLRKESGLPPPAFGCCNLRKLRNLEAKKRAPCQKKRSRHDHEYPKHQKKKNRGSAEKIVAESTWFTLDDQIKKGKESKEVEPAEVNLTLPSLENPEESLIPETSPTE